ncbi:MAG: hypothetical protein JO297_17910 [Nitrososphaeraceae archaeon]|nr:hypothetical protein [Nitrososphaeraceae archaeon]
MHVFFSIQTDCSINQPNFFCSFCCIHFSCIDELFCFCCSSWETEVWVAESPGHMIHFNGERFLGPYEPYTEC